jgi:hypothetical protein
VPYTGGGQPGEDNKPRRSPPGGGVSAYQYYKDSVALLNDFGFSNNDGRISVRLSSNIIQDLINLISDILGGGGPHISPKPKDLAASHRPECVQIGIASICVNQSQPRYPMGEIVPTALSGLSAPRPAPASPESRQNSPNRPSPLSPLQQLNAWKTRFFCTSSPEGAVEFYMESGATKGALGGAFAGAGLGIAPVPIGVVPGFLVGGFVGGTVGAGGGALFGGAAAGVCSYTGAYKK